DKGELCVTLRHYINAVWLTDSSSPRGHGLAYDNNLTKAEYRIEVELDRRDPKLHRYRKWARDIGLDPSFMRLMRRSAGAGAEDGDWYVYFGTIKPPFIRIINTILARTTGGAPQWRTLGAARWPLLPGKDIVSLESQLPAEQPVPHRVPRPGTCPPAHGVAQPAMHRAASMVHRPSHRLAVRAAAHPAHHPRHRPVHRPAHHLGAARLMLRQTLHHRVRHPNAVCSWSTTAPS